MIYLIFSSRFELLASITRRSQGILEIQNPSFLNLRVFAGFLRICAGFLRVKLVVFLVFPSPEITCAFNWPSQLRVSTLAPFALKRASYDCQ